MKYENFVDREREPKNMIFMPRDVRILEHIHEFDGVLADYQVRDLEFTGMRQAQHRLGLLFHNGYLSRTARAGRIACGNMVYWLGKGGAEVLAEARKQRVKQFKYLETPRWAQVAHDLASNDFTIILQKACRKHPDLQLRLWINEGTFRADPDKIDYINRRGEKATYHVYPDRYFEVERLSTIPPFRSRLLFELDMATHSNKHFANTKILPGIAYIRSEQYRMRFGENKGRWLVVTTSDERLKYLKETAESVAEANARIWYFTTFKKVTVDTVLTEPIWQQGGSEKEVPLFKAR
jgi:hypothetical protein